MSHDAAMNDRELWGRLVESAIGAHLHNYKSSGVELQYWRERSDEVDFVLSQGDKVTAIEVKSGRHKGALAGLKKFTQHYQVSKPLVVGTGGISVADFLLSAPDQWLL
jgi:predicted AAA+ superfamily ATPase